MKLTRLALLPRLALVGALLASFIAAPISRAENASSDVAVKGTAFLTKNHKDLLLVLELENVSDHPVTVLTKKLDLLSNFADAPVSANFILGYTSEAQGGQTSIPSVYEFAPVTLAPKEKTTIRHELRNENQLKRITHDTELVCTYQVSDDWASKLKVLGVTVKTAAFKPSTIPSSAMPR